MKSLILKSQIIKTNQSLKERRIFKIESKSLISNTIKTNKIQLKSTEKIFSENETTYCFDDLKRKDENEDEFELEIKKNSDKFNKDLYEEFNRSSLEKLICFLSKNKSL